MKWFYIFKLWSNVCINCIFCNSTFSCNLHKYSGMQNSFVDERARTKQEFCIRFILSTNTRIKIYKKTNKIKKEHRMKG